MTKPDCSSCHRSVPSLSDVGICGVCQAYLAVRPLGVEQRPRVPCVRCHGVEILRAVPRSPEAKRLLATLQVKTEDKGILGTSGIEVTGVRLLGELETYICRTCGFVEWYCVAPKAVPIGPAYNTELLDVSTGGPYR